MNPALIRVAEGAASASRTSGRVFLVGIPRDYASRLAANLRAAGLRPLLRRSPELLLSLPGQLLAVMNLESDEEAKSAVALHRARPDAVIVAVVAAPAPRVLRLAINCGARTVIGRDETIESAVGSVYDATRGYARLRAEALSLAFDTRAGLALTNEEVGWLRLMADDDLTMEAIAKRLNWSPREFHRLARRLYTRIGVRNRPGAAAKAREWGLAEALVET